MGSLYRGTRTQLNKEGPHDGVGAFLFLPAVAVLLLLETGRSYALLQATLLGSYSCVFGQIRTLPDSRWVHFGVFSGVLKEFESP